jgi:arylsulfatase A-like enzyme
MGAPMDGFTKDPQIASDAAAWLKDRAPGIGRSQPWYLAVNFVNPHDVMYFDTDADEMVQVRGMFPIFGAPDAPIYKQKWPTSLPASFADDLSQQPPAVQRYKDFCDTAYGRIPGDREDMWNNHVNYYINCMVDVDRHMGTVLDALEENGQSENTIVIFTSDHGEMGGAHQLRQKGGVAFRETVNVPLVIVDPRQKGGVSTEAVGSHLDLVPTTLAYAGLSESEVHQRYPFLKGHDLSGIAADPGGDGPRGSRDKPGKGALYTYDMVATIDGEWLQRNATLVMDTAAAEAGLEFHRGTEAFREMLETIGAPDAEKREVFRGVFDGRYKLIRYFGLGHYHLPRSVEDLLENNDVALYDTRNDPEEVHNLADRDSPGYDESILSALNAKLNSLITEEIGEDKALIAL